MKRTILYAVVAAVAVAVGAIGIVGCGGDYGERSDNMDKFLDKFHYNKRVLPKYTLTYDGNGADSGDVPRGPTMYDSNTIVRVMGAGTLIKYGSTFSGWASQADGGGASFAEGRDIRITNDIILYAVWNNTVTYEVTVKSSPVGMYVSGGRRYKPDETVTIIAEESSNGWHFQNWTTTSNGVSFADSNKAETSFRMPKNNVTVTAVFAADSGKTDLFTDDRDGNVYITVTIGEQTWMARNLDYLNEETETKSSWCYDDDPENCVKYGRLYNWDAAKTVCPTGWKLPDKEDWNRLVTAVGGASVAGKKLKATSGWYGDGNGTDDFGFSALPGGYFSGIGSDGAGVYGYWWTNTYDSVIYSSCQNIQSSDYVNMNRCATGQGYSVRCIKND